MNDFKEVLKTDKPVLVDFYATWCGPCKMQAPVLEQLKEKVGDRAVIIKVDVDKNQQLAQQYMVQSIPTLIIFMNGEPAWRASGFHPLEQLEAKIKEFEKK
ncbi:MAG: thioredoxin [Muribaculaceae bacterium]|nr:thioredoxin [Muribaculaceae bacterium]